MKRPRIVISGAGIAGNALCIALNRRGIIPTIIERADRPQPGGHTVDLRGSSQDILREWGMLESVHALAVPEERMVAIGRGGRRLWSMPAASGAIVADLEVGREDLNDVLRQAGDANSRFGEEIIRSSLTQSGVQIETSSGRTIDADLLVAAEGTHSALRARMFPESSLAYLGGYMAFAPVPFPPDFHGEMRVYTAPGGVMVAIRPGRAHGHAIVAIRAPRVPQIERDTSAQRKFVVEHIGRAGISGDWHVPSILDASQHDPGFHCDALLKVSAPTWHRERTVLLGDAAWSGSPLTGRGTAMAIMGAEALADAIARRPHDLDSACRDYETRMRPLLRWSQRDASPRTLRAWAPASAGEILLNTIFMRTLTRTPLRTLLTRPDGGNLPRPVHAAS
ncbi:NAD(P)/FAD-dependent oxidoreductase [Agromyces sp. Soil535]|uniref:FAD-dependent oxidoreductase n=1 Tax=Agromyces sp. Soil535 TaxID=1736390 RepID=UPI000AC4BE8E|nr:FAD-dependent monooxygenase [Agromyces sp. Soil535]